MKNKAVIILEHLLEGNSFSFNSNTFRLFKPNEIINFPSGEFVSNGYYLAIELGKDSYIGAEITLEDFINLSEKVSDEVIALLIANKVLNQHNKKG